MITKHVKALAETCDLIPLLVQTRPFVVQNIKEDICHIVKVHEWVAGQFSYHLFDLPTVTSRTEMECSASLK